jgi:adenylate cyclase
MTTGADESQTDASESDGSTDRQGEVFDFVLGGPARYTRDELIERAGFDSDRAKKLWQAMGFPQAEDDARAFTDKDLRALEVAKELQDSGLVDERLMLVLARAMAQTISRLADAHVAAYVDYLTENSDDSDGSDHSGDDSDSTSDDASDDGNEPGAVAAAGAQGLVDAPLVNEVEWLLPRLDELIGFVWRRQLAGSLEQLLPHATDDQKPLSIGFCDLAGFTKLSRQLSRMELARLTETFEETASGVIADLGGRTVKTIGDEIMYYAFDAATAVEIGVTLIEKLAEIEDLPAVHAGVATGPVLLRFGDVYGSTVNIAARLTSIARPDTLLVDKATASELSDSDRFSIRQTRPRRVSGYRHLLPFSVRRPNS